MTLAEALTTIVEGFHEHKIPCALTGGFAYSLYAEPRTTMDIDVIFDYLSIKPEYSGYEKEMLSRVRILPFRGVEIPVLAPEDLYILKKASSRERDRLDAEALVSLSGETSLDIDYIRKWGKTLGVDTF